MSIQRFMYKLLRYFRLYTLVVLLALIACGWSTKPAQAMLRQHHDSPGVLRYHSQVSIKDNKGYAWQVLLFKENYNNPIRELRLRLVGFPGVVEVAHPQPLEINTASGKLLLASDAYALAAPAPNVGEYELTNILPKLPTTDALKLYVPAKNAQPLVLNIPNSVVTEWQWLVAEID
jgi:uncharacterized protein DUF3122